jgi:benzoyl-CoA reductase subunit B
MSEDRLAATHALNQYQREWFTGFRKRVLQEGEAYVIAEPSAPHEIFHAMGVEVVSTPWYAAIIAAKQLSPYYFDLSERLGYHNQLPRYLSLPLMSSLDDDPARAPYGGLPKPALIVDRLRAEFPQRIGEQWAKFYGARYFPIDNPAQIELGPRWWEQGRTQWDTFYEPHRLDFVVDQYEELIRETERLTGKVFDHPIFVEQMHRINELCDLVDEAKQILAHARPSPVPLNEQLNNVMGVTWHRGTQWAIDHMRAYVAELRDRVARGVAACPNERFRLLWLNNGLWFNTGLYRAFEHKYGAVFVWSMYTNYLADGYYRDFERDPLRALASRHVSANDQLHLPPWMADWIIEQAKEFGAHGAVMLVPREDRLSGWGVKLCARALEAAGVPVLMLEGNSVDARLWDNAKVLGLVEAFIETRLQA